MASQWKAYLIFTKKERTGIIVMVAIIFLLTVVPHFFPDKEVPVHNEEWDALQKQVSDITTVRDTGYFVERDQGNLYSGESGNAREFLFDPNHLSETGWTRLGVRARTIQTIMKFVSRGGSFKKPEDLSKIYGLSKADYERLLPFVKIERPKELNNPEKRYQKHEEFPASPAEPAKTHEVTAIEINSADTTALIALPGIGSKLANRIINFREKLGGFYSIDQVAETFGLPDSTFQKIRQYLFCQPNLIKVHNLNTASIDALKSHPYIRWKLANAIINYKKQHGEFASTEEILKIDLIDKQLYTKLQPYFTVK